jgi:hypothetical protein
MSRDSRKPAQARTCPSLRALVYFEGAAGFAISKTRSCTMDNGGASAAVVAVCVKRMNFACVGLNTMSVLALSPAPVATGVQTVPFSDVSSL